MKYLSLFENFDHNLDEIRDLFQEYIDEYDLTPLPNDGIYHCDRGFYYEIFSRDQDMYKGYYNVVAYYTSGRMDRHPDDDIKISLLKLGMKEFSERIRSMGYISYFPTVTQNSSDDRYRTIVLSILIKI